MEINIWWQIWIFFLADIVNVYLHYDDNTGSFLEIVLCILFMAVLCCACAAVSKAIKQQKQQEEQDAERNKSKEEKIQEEMDAKEEKEAKEGGVYTMIAYSNLKKKRDQKYMNDLQKDAAQDEQVEGMPEFASKWQLDAKSLRRLKKYDVMFRKYVVRKFNPKVAKARGAIRKYIDALQKPPQRWRLEAMQEDELLEGDCETTPIADSAVIGKFDESVEESSEVRLDLDGIRFFF